MNRAAKSVRKLAATLDDAFGYKAKHRHPALGPVVVRGQYELDLPIGEHKVAISSIGYEPIEAVLQVYSDSELDLKITKEAVQLGEVVVEASALDQNVKSTNVGLESLSAKEIKKLPAF